MAHILIFGDSITYGAWDTEGSGWAGRLRKYLDEKHEENENNYFLVYNMGVSGDTTEGLVKRMESEIVPRLDEDEETIILIAKGINDSQYITSEKRNKVAFEKFQENISTIIDIAKQYSDKILFIGLTPVDESKTVPWDTNKEYRNDLIKKYSDAVEELCKQNNIAFLPLFDVLGNQDLFDGLHPNSPGHQKIFETARNFLIENKILTGLE